MNLPDAQRCPVRHGAVGDVLGAAGLDEVDVGDEDGDPGQDTKDGGQVDKVLEHLLGVVGDVHEGQEGEGSAQEEGGPGNTTAVGLLEDGGGGLVGGKTVEGTAGNVEIGVGGREDEDEDTSVDDVGEGVDTGDLGGDDEGTGAGSGLLGVGEGELVTVVGDNHADEEDRETVEEEDTVEGQVDGLGDAATGVLGLASSNTDKLSSQVGEGGVDHDGPETEELAQGTFGVARGDGKGTGVGPVLEAEGFAVGATTTSDDEGEENDADNDHDLDGRQPELELSEKLDTTEVIDAEDDDNEDGNEDTWIEFLSRYPFLDNEGGCGKLVGSNDDVLAPVSVSMVSLCDRRTKKPLDEESLTSIRERNREKGGSNE